MFKVEKHLDPYINNMSHITVINLLTGKSAITTCYKKRVGRVVSELKKRLIIHT